MMPEPNDEFDARCKLHEARIRRVAAENGIPLGAAADIVQAAHSSAEADSVRAGWGPRPTVIFASTRARARAFIQGVLGPAARAETEEGAGHHRHPPRQRPS